MASPTPGVHSNSCPSSQWCHLAISSSVIHFSSCLLSFPASGSFQMSQFFTSGGQSIGVSASVLPKNIQFPYSMDLLDFLAVQGALKGLLQHHSSKASILWHSPFYIVHLSHPYMTTGKTIALTSWTFVGKVMSLLFNMLSRLVIAFLPRSKRVLISWLPSPFAVILVTICRWAGRLHPNLNSAEKWQQMELRSQLEIPCLNTWLRCLTPVSTGYRNQTLTCLCKKFHQPTFHDAYRLS